MKMKEPSSFDWIATLIYLGLAAFGSIAKTAFDIIEGRPTGIKIAFCQLIVSMFAGALTVLLCIAFEFRPELTGCMTGSAGWLGAEMIRTIAGRMKSNAEK